MVFLFLFLFLFVTYNALEIVFVEINGHVVATFAHMDPKHLFMALTFGLKFKHWFLELGEYNNFLSTECQDLAGKCVQKNYHLGSKTPSQIWTLPSNLRLIEPKLEVQFPKMCGIFD